MDDDFEDPLASSLGARRHNDLYILLSELHAAQCVELALLVSTLLLELGSVAATLHAHPTLYKPYIHMLHVQPVPGYQQLRELLQSRE